MINHSTHPKGSTITSETSLYGLVKGKEYEVAGWLPNGRVGILVDGVKQFYKTDNFK